MHACGVYATNMSKAKRTVVVVVVVRKALFGALLTCQLRMYRAERVCKYQVHKINLYILVSCVCVCVWYTLNAHTHMHEPARPRSMLGAYTYTHALPVL